MTAVVNNSGLDPMIHLTNGTRIVLKLEGENARPQSVVQAAQEAHFDETGAWPYVYGMPNEPGEETEPEPEPEPEPEGKQLKKKKPQR